MNTFVLYMTTVLIWGSTWLAIKFQLGTVPPDVSVAYRFFIAAMVLIAWVVIRGKDMRYPVRDHLWIALQGLLLFSANYYVFYVASAYLTTGLVAVVFSTIVPLNIIFGRIFFKTPATFRVVGGAVLGLGGLMLVFRPEIENFNFADDGAFGLALCLFATTLASLGNMASARNQRRGLPVMQTNTYGMLYGSIFTFIFAYFSGSEFTFDPSIEYVSSLLYLALFGSVVAFGAYLTLLGRIGAGRAAYASVLFPVVALTLSVFFEDYVFAPEAIIGAILVLGGNVLVLARVEHAKNIAAFFVRKNSL
ncbi:MAG: EamA family transporter [Rhodospirillaceae bacterium]|nr:EamA family transporter [Rhodospirillaceae bacterium]